MNQPRQAWSRIDHISFWGLLLFAAALRFHTLAEQPFWSDEYYSYRCISQPTFLQNLIHTLVADIYPPAFYVLSWAVRKIGGDSLALIRLVPALGATACVGLLFVIFRRWAGLAPAIAAGLASALSPLGVYYAQEFKLYSLFAACNLWVLYEYLRLGEDPKRGPGRLAFATAASYYTYYLAPYLLAPLFLHAAWRGIQGAREEALRALKGLTYGSLCAIPLLPFFAKSILVFEGPNYPVALGKLPWYTAQNFSLGFWAPEPLALAAALLCAAGLALFWARGRALAGPLAPLLVLFAVLPHLLNWFSSLALKPNYSDRALLACAYAWTATAAGGWSLLPGRAKYAALLGLVFLQISALTTYYDPATRPRYDYASAYHELKKAWKPGEPVFHANFQSLYPFKYHGMLEGDGMKQWRAMEAPAFVNSGAAEGMRAKWRKAKAWLETKGLGINAGAEESWAWGERLGNEAIGAAPALWFIDMDRETYARWTRHALNYSRNHFDAWIPYDFEAMAAPYLSKYEAKSRLSLGPGVTAVRYERKSAK